MSKIPTDSNPERSLSELSDPQSARDSDVEVEKEIVSQEIEIAEHLERKDRLQEDYEETILANRILEAFIQEQDEELFDKVLSIVLKGSGSTHGVFGYIPHPGLLICPSLSKMLDACEVEGKTIHYPQEKWKGLWGRALTEKKSFYSNVTPPVPLGHPIIHNDLAAPILFQDEVIGLLHLANKEGGYREKDRKILNRLCVRIAPFLFTWINRKLHEEERKRAEQAVRQGRERSELLATISERLLRSQNPQVAIEETCGMAMIFLDCQIFFNYLVEAPDEPMHLNTYAGITPGEAESIQSLDFGAAVCGCVARDSKRIIAEDVQQCSDKRVELIKSFGVQAYCCHPLMAQNQLIGTLSFGTRTRVKFTDDDVFLMESITGQVAAAVQRMQTEETLKRSESRYRELVQNANSAIIRWRENGVITFINEYAQSFFGYSVEEIVGRDVRILLPKAESKDVDPQELVQNILEHPERYVHNVNENVCRDGRRIWMSWTNRPIFDQDGRLSEILAVGTDITALKRMEDDLKRSHDELELRVRQRTEELSTALQNLQERSDQLRRMNSELTLAEQREKKKLAHILHDGLQQILVGAKLQVESMGPGRSDELLQLKDIIGEAIDASRSLALELHPPILLRNNLCAALEWLAGRKREKYGLHVKTKFPESLQSLDYEVMLLLFQSVRELLFNIVKHSGVKEASVELNKLDRHILLTIADKGVGFDTSEFSVEDSKSGGFGLFSIQERLSIIDGQMEINSAPVDGCRITIKIPLSTAAKDTSQESTVEQRIDDKSVFPNQISRRADMKIHIMLTDDHEVVRQAVANLIKSESDFEIVGEASDGKSAVDLAREIRPDVVLMDVNMPVMNGIEATRRIHNEFPDISIIGFSIYDDDEQKNAMVKAGAVDYFIKRGSAKGLIKVIRNSIRKTVSP